MIAESAAARGPQAADRPPPAATAACRCYPVLLSCAYAEHMLLHALLRCRSLPQQLRSPVLRSHCRSAAAGTHSRRRAGVCMAAAAVNKLQALIFDCDGE
jgi:hypothetical protein